MPSVGCPERGIADAAVTPAGPDIEAAGAFVAGRALDHRVADAAPGEFRLGGGEQFGRDAAAARCGGDVELVDLVAFDSGEADDAAAGLRNDATRLQRPQALIETGDAALGDDARRQDGAVAVMPGVVPELDDGGAVFGTERADEGGVRQGFQ